MYISIVSLLETVAKASFIFLLFRYFIILSASGLNLISFETSFDKFLLVCKISFSVKLDLYFVFKYSQ